MEAKLFFISLWCGLYALLIRGAMKKESLAKNPFVSMGINGVFWGTTFFLGGLLYSSYTEQPDRITFGSFVYFFAGFAFGVVLGFIRSRKEDARQYMIEDNLEWADTGFSAILLASIVMFFVIQAFKIPSGSMRMTFIEGDHLFVNKFIYGVPIPFTEKKIIPFKKIHQRDIVIFRFPSTDVDSPHYGKDFIKRVIALEGQKVQVINKQVYVDDVALDEPYKQHVDKDIFPNRTNFTPEEFQKRWEDRDEVGETIRDNFGPIVVPAGNIFVMGDNRDRSYDGRFWGPLPIKAIKGKAWLLYWPISRFKVAH